MSVKYKTNKEIATEIVKKFKDSPSLTLSRKLLSDYPERFTSLEQARSSIRLVRGAIGKKQEHLATVKRDKGIAYNPLSIPASFEREWKPFDIERCYKSMLILNDIHAPYHNIQAITLALQKGKKEKIDSILFNGDLADFHTLSKYEKDPLARSYNDERNTVIDLFKAIKKYLPHVKIYWKLGNHEERLEKYLNLNAPVFIDCPEFDYHNFFQLDKFNISLIDDKRIVRFGKMNIFHGHEFAGCPNSAKALWMKVKTNCCMGHIHTIDEHNEQDINGNVTSAYIMGTLGELYPKYLPLNRWKRGFAIIKRLDDEGHFNFNNYKIINNQVY